MITDGAVLIDRFKQYFHGSNSSHIHRNQCLLIEIETAYPAAGKLTGVGRPGQMLVEARGRVPGCQPQNHFLFLAEGANDVVLDQLRAHSAHVFEVAGNEDFYRHR